MEETQDMLTEKLGVDQMQHCMEINKIMLKEKLDLLGILKESLKIPYKSPKFIFLTSLTSMPLMFTMILHEFILQAFIFETKSILTMTPPSDYSYRNTYESVLDTLILLVQNASPKVFQLAFLYLVPLHLLDLFNTIVTINSASTIYAEKTVRLGEMLLTPCKSEIGITGPLLTSLYVLFLNCFILSGLVWAVTNTILVLAIMNSVFPIGGFFIVTNGAIFFFLAVKWIEWSAVWNMAVVFSVLDGRHKLAALGASGHFNQGSRKCGLQLMLLFFLWKIILRLPCYYMGGQEKWIGLVAMSFLSCVGNVMKWVVCTVYFFDCKKRTMEKKVDADAECQKVLNDHTGKPVCNV